MTELELTEEQVREERLGSVDVRAHWLYLAVVLGGSLLLMVVLMALLDGSG
jgi:hypothetical protein